jgi:hypothetical protein
VTGRHSFKYGQLEWSIRFDFLGKSEVWFGIIHPEDNSEEALAVNSYQTCHHGNSLHQQGTIIHMSVNIGARTLTFRREGCTCVETFYGIGLSEFARSKENGDSKDPVTGREHKVDESHAHVIADKQKRKMDKFYAEQLPDYKFVDADAERNYVTNALSLCHARRKFPRSVEDYVFFVGFKDPGVMITLF